MLSVLVSQVREQAFCRWFRISATHAEHLPKFRTSRNRWPWSGYASPARSGSEGGIRDKLSFLFRFCV
ncbi:MAG TPA: hypothetical protein DCG12_19715 [Planctomycetaceae bacterium]|nr:hypothetical protein [Planctomycetaceae bacterium]